MSSGPEPIASPWLTKREAADYARVSMRTLERAMHDGDLRHAGEAGLAVRIRLEWVDDWLENRGRRRSQG
jgi:excisionase family DNA binding protein